MTFQCFYYLYEKCLLPDVVEHGGVGGGVGG